MATPKTSTMHNHGHDFRVWRAGVDVDENKTTPVVFLPGFMGLPTWIPFLDLLAREREVIVPSLPGFPGAEGHDRLDDLLDWTNATLDVLEGVSRGPIDLIASSVSGALALEAAAATRGLIQRLVLVAPFGCFDEHNPTTDIWATRPGTDYGELLCEKPENFHELWALPEGEDEVEWSIIQTRAREASARFLWPFGDTGIVRRGYRVTQPTLIVRGSKDRIMPASPLRKLKDAIAGETMLQEIGGAGHMVELDTPEALAGTVQQFLE